MCRYLIVRKYLQFTDVDHARLPHCLEDFRCAETRCEKIGTHLWTRANTTLVQFYNFLFSFAFLIWSMEQTGGMGDVISIMMGLMPAIIITAGIFISARMDKSWNLVEQEEEVAIARVCIAVQSSVTPAPIAGNGSIGEAKGVHIPLPCSNTRC